MIIDLFADLKKISANKRGTREKIVLDIKAPSFKIDADERALAKLAADAIAQTITSNMLAGKAPDGSPLPSASAATIERRAYRKAQDARGGKPADRYKKGTHRNARKNHRKRFRAPRLGQFHPGDGVIGKVGVESTMLARSVVAIVTSSGFRVFFANPRAIVDASGNSPAARVFKRIGIWSQKAQMQPAIQGALQGVAKALASGRRMKALTSLLQTGKGLGRLVKAAESSLDT